MKLLHTSLASLALLAAAADARADDEQAEEDNVPDHAIRQPDRDLVLDLDLDRRSLGRFRVTLGRDLPTVGRPVEGRCGVLAIGRFDGDGHLEHKIELIVDAVSSDYPLDDAADLGERPGHLTVRLYPPSPEWASGFLNVDVDCNGAAEAHLPVWVMMAHAPSEELAAIEEMKEADAEDDVELGGEASSGCTATRTPPHVASGLFALGAFALLGLRRLRSRRG